MIRSSYSLPGQIVLSLPNLPAGHEGRLREVRDLQIVVEGKSEFFDTAGKSAPFAARLILTSRPIHSHQTVHVHHHPRHSRQAPLDPFLQSTPIPLTPHRRRCRFRLSTSRLATPFSHLWPHQDRVRSCRQIVYRMDRSRSISIRCPQHQWPKYRFPISRPTSRFTRSALPSGREKHFCLPPFRRQTTSTSFSHEPSSY